MIRMPAVAGYFAGAALAVAIALLVPSLGFAVGLLLGFGFSMIGLLIGMAASR